MMGKFRAEREKGVLTNFFTPWRKREDFGESFSKPERTHLLLQAALS